jgi:hypothetical protein
MLLTPALLAKAGLFHNLDAETQHPPLIYRVRVCGHLVVIPTSRIPHTKISFNFCLHNGSFSFRSFNLVNSP